MNPIERRARTFDRFHERHPIVAFPYAVMKKFSDDQAGGLAAQTTYYGFLALFPLLLVLTTFLGLVIRNDPLLQSRVLARRSLSFPSSVRRFSRTSTRYRKAAWRSPSVSWARSTARSGRSE